MQQASIVKKVLVVDESQAMCTAVESILNDVGCAAVAIARSSQEALAILDNASLGQLPGAIIVDWSLSGISGQQFVCAVRADTRYNHILILIMSSAAEMPSVRGGLGEHHNGVVDYIPKPFTRESLIQKLEARGLSPQSAA